MIRVPQTGQEVPAALAERGVGPKERTRAVAHYEADPRPEKSFPFKAYSDRTVKEALFALFRGKCAYCESRFDATQPVDVEHWRPKGGFEEDGKLEQPGYYWLAAAWDNLLPSCIDCNRERTHRIQPTGTVRKIGKANRFPVADPVRRARRPADDLSGEGALLLNPYLDHPEAVLEVDQETGVMRVQTGITEADAKRGQASIEVYALNRTDLVHARKALLLRLQQRMHTIRLLVRLLEQPGLSADAWGLVEDLLAHEMLDLHRQADPDQPYSLAARQAVATFVQEMTGCPAFREAGNGSVG